MNLEEMVARLRARLNERSPDAFDDSEDLIPLLNEGARYVAKRLMAINRRVNVVIDKADVQASVTRYPMPEDFLFEIEVWYGADLEERLVAVEPNRDKRGYYMDGMWLNFTFEPETITGGLTVKHCAAISMIDDADIPPIPQDLHMAIVVAAERFAVPQVGEASKAQMAELNELLGDLPMYYRKENAEPPTLKVEGLSYGVKKGY